MQKERLAMEEWEMDRRTLLRLGKAGLVALAVGALITKVTVPNNNDIKAQVGIACAPDEDKCGPWRIGIT